MQTFTYKTERVHIMLDSVIHTHFPFCYVHVFARLNSNKISWKYIDIFFGFALHKYITHIKKYSMYICEYKL